MVLHIYVFKFGKKKTRYNRTKRRVNVVLLPSVTKHETISKSLITNFTINSFSYIYLPG